MADRVTVFNHIFHTAATSAVAGEEMDVGGLAGVGFQIEGINGDTITFESTIDQSTWYSVEVINRTTGAKATTATADGLFYLPIAGEDQFRCRISTYNAGSITCTGKGVVNPAGMTTADIGDVDVTSTVAPAGKAGASGNVHEPAVNTAAVVTLAAAGAGVSHVLGLAAWSYDAAPTAGSLTIEDGAGTTIFKVDITAAGAGYFPFVPGMKGTANTAMIATLAAAGAGVDGIVSLHTWTE